MRRRTFLAGIAAAATAGCSGAGPAPGVLAPPAQPGVERLEPRRSAARGRDVDLWTAVPRGWGTGRGLPVCLVLHGASKAPRDFPALGLAGFLTDSAQRGAPPFVLAGASGDRLGWRPAGGGDDPQAMLRRDLLEWCDDRDFDTGRVAALGWSMGGAGALLLAETFPSFLRGVAALSPAVSPGDDVFAGAGRLVGTPVGLWCGTGDDLIDDVRALETALPAPKAAGSYGPGGHDFGFYATVLPAVLDFVGAALGPSPGVPGPSGAPSAAPSGAPPTGS
ncbi:alpha/beta hydrolase-fold protein [Spirilliplanes yamanashiensis]|uniref:Acyl-CoA:diacylglycerol acyltransferase n=1 Tax=Spirilliplanes yamanashiensis TaxID=42233 RepID=A0A8J3Y5R0_9ACTN|nr:alpha/beta hydrolase-fold protein [Spirilliplanes yamanashiensis]MDP9819366.1 pimeloyl-ACP methyl ester carboxylesterase [Spirilliplanes yamanashiensis]GIJ01810.1 esterase [Spirilliplanes yamanashiensis]